MITKNELLALIVIIGFSLSGYSAWSLYSANKAAIINEFNNDVDNRAASFFRAVSINLETLHSLSVLFSGSTTPSNAQFSNEAKNILDRHSDIQALEWIPRVLNSERSLYETSLRQDFPDFQFSERESQGNMVRANERAEYYPVYYVEPLSGNEAAFGFDLASNSTRRETLESSVSEARPLVTASITLVQGRRSQQGFLAFLPLYDGNPSTLRERQESLKGFVLGVFRIGDIYNNSEINGNSLEIEILLLDETPSSEHDSILYVDRLSDGLELNESISYKTALPDIWGRQWSMVARPSQNYVSERNDQSIVIVFLSGIIVTVFLFFYIQQIFKRTSIIQQTVVDRTRELTESNQELVYTQGKLKKEQKRTEESLQTRTEELKDAQLQLIQSEKMEMIGTLAAGVAHEVKNPLAIIQLGIDYISKNKNEEAINEIAEDIQESIFRADTVIKELLDFSASKQLNIKLSDVNPTLENSLLLVKHELMKKNINVILDYDDNLPQVMIDKNKIEQAFINLITNAINAMDEKGTLTVKTYSSKIDEFGPYIKLRKSEKIKIGELGVVVEIGDDGTGILKDKLDKIFDPFFTTKRTGTSIGLGLTVIQNIIHLHNAVIKIMNKEDKGVIATVIFKAERGV